LEVALPESFTVLKIDPQRILDAGRLSPADEVELEEDDFQLQSSWTEDAEGGAPPKPAKKSDPPSNSEKRARASGLGLWALPNPEKPWVWRKEKCTRKW
jgi:hypothetical protein